MIEGTRLILAEAGIPAARLDLVIHGTTLATNALIERRARAPLCSQRAGSAIPWKWRTSIGSSNTICIWNGPRRWCRAICVWKWPSVWRPMVRYCCRLDEAGLRPVIETLRAEKIEALAISFLHAYVNPAHEERARAIIAAALPDLAITLSHEVCREIREYERTSHDGRQRLCAAADGALSGGDARGLAALGATCPLLLMMSSGGICTIETARRFPVRLVESGPAGGVILARRIAARGGYDRALSFDMGGTTAKITLIDDYTPQQSRHFEVARAYRFAKGSGIPVRIPVIDMVEIGAGGGSIARVDSLRRIVVGPGQRRLRSGPGLLRPRRRPRRR